MAEEQGKRMRPPYASAGDLDTFFDRIAKMGAPVRIDQKWVKDYKLAAAQPPAIVSVLKWLGIIDQNGKPTTRLWDEVRVPASRQAKLEELVRASYSEVFNAIDVSEASRDELEGTFIQVYQSGDPGRHVVCFVALCRHAGIPTKAVGPSKPKPGDGEPRRRERKRERKASPRPKTPPSGQQQVQGVSTGITIALNVEIPAEWSEEQIRERVEAVRRATSSDANDAS
jgi:hypothetical protein